MAFINRPLGARYQPYEPIRAVAPQGWWAGGGARMDLAGRLSRRPQQQQLLNDLDQAGIVDMLYPSYLDRVARIGKAPGRFTQNNATLLPPQFRGGAGYTQRPGEQREGFTAHLFPALGGRFTPGTGLSTGEKFTPSQLTDTQKIAIHANLHGFFSGQKAVGVPGARRGVPTPEQQRFLDAIFGSSTRPVDLLPPIGTTNLFDANHPEVQALAKQLGMPASTAGVGGHLRSGYSALSHIMGKGKGPDLRGGENRMTWNRESTKLGVTELFGKGSGAGRPPPSTVAWLTDLIRAINKSRG